MLLHTSLIVCVEWYVLANKLYMTFYTPQPIHLDAKIWNEDGNNKTVICHFNHSLSHHGQTDKWPSIVSVSPTSTSQ